VDDGQLSNLTATKGFNESTLSPNRTKKHWSVSPFNTISDFGTGKIMVKKNHVGGGAPPSIARDN
jgi:hypothetical protein